MTAFLFCVLKKNENVCNAVVSCLLPPRLCERLLNPCGGRKDETTPSSVLSGFLG